ncbi:MAG: dTMP kinase [Candidatus Krumholzibacteria bacterium]|jgi:dTMP kinase|nr:dTMP kinase [Candidatus Krumholzibacteria bacterium]MDP6668752.1 dTMP kinase [Candidatus Krumholzibacteria bacterium]MDP6797503.1 dTMP kinase [Candidatus Krumholzibacteria bacterium]MDP7021498.1 dTMP kinase [Candidatus Krumholzibacteria bacterium]
MNSPNAPGFFLTLEGGEGSGKSTLKMHLREYLESRGQEVLLTREPGGPGISEAIRDILLDNEHREMDGLTELFLYLASRRQNLVQTILPHLKKGGVVISDRFLDASVAYQGGGRELGHERVDRLNREAVGEHFPDLSFLIDVDPDLGFRRGPGQRESDRIENEAMSFHRKVREAYLDAAKRNPERFRILDGSRSAEEVAAIAIAELESFLNSRV